MPGKYLKKAAKACTGKARFETQQEAERTAEYRYRAYQCAICHHWHLTSRSGASRAPVESQPEPAVEKPKPLATMGDLDWSGLGAPAKARVPKSHAKPAKIAKGIEPTAPIEIRGQAKCASGIRKDGRVVLVLAGRLVKSRPVLDSLRSRIAEGSIVEVAIIEDSAVVLGVIG